MCAKYVVAQTSMDDLARSHALEGRLRSLPKKKALVLGGLWLLVYVVKWMWRHV
jgi:hypothetical protein